MLRYLELTERCKIITDVQVTLFFETHSCHISRERTAIYRKVVHKSHKYEPDSILKRNLFILFLPALPVTPAILAFDCTFRVARGDIYTTGLRTNSTPVYRQKTAFYEKLIETSLERSGLTVSRTEIMNFGDGPTIALSFRVFLDMRKIKM